MNDRLSDKTVVWFGLIGLLVFFTGVFKFWSAWNASDWPATEGLVLEASIEVRSDAETTSYTPHLTYQYDVGENRYVASRIDFVQQSFNLNEWSRDFIHNHPAGSKIQVYYNADQPREASLFVGVPDIAYAQPIIGIVFLAISLCKALMMGKETNADTTTTENASP